jgi:hypothetical protein
MMRENQDKGNKSSEERAWRVVIKFMTEVGEFINVMPNGAAARRG